MEFSESKKSQVGVELLTAWWCKSMGSAETRDMRKHAAEGLG